MSKGVDLNGLKDWLKNVKGLTRIDMFKLNEYVDEYNNWLMKK